MKLIQVHVIRAQVPQRRLELGRRAVARSLQRLAGKKGILSIRGSSAGPSISSALP